MRVEFIDGQVIMWPKGKTIDNAVVIGEQEGGLYKLKGHLVGDIYHHTHSSGQIGLVKPLS